jgi:sirohydrochlorin ferrochelatase
MPDDALLLIGRASVNAGEVLATHAGRIERRGGVDAVHVATYESEPVRELREEFAALSADRVYAVPMCAAHTRETAELLPAALSAVPGELRYCEPVGASPAVTEALVDRAADRAPADDDVSLALVGFGSSSKPYQRRVADYHAARIRERDGFGEVLTCYLLENPAVECVRYNVSGASCVAVPLFLTRTEATEQTIPGKLELDRGGMAYGDPLGTHPRVTDAIHAGFERQRVLATERGAVHSAGADLPGRSRPVATDGEGR